MNVSAVFSFENHDLPAVQVQVSISSSTSTLISSADQIWKQRKPIPSNNPTGRCHRNQFCSVAKIKTN
jgi:hypothetical protein